MKYSESDKNSKELFWAVVVVFFVGIHSILLGLTIYFFTDFFYKTFFAVNVENLFFVRQSGIFLFLAGLFYLYPLLDLKNLYNLILLVIVSKVVAVMFLISNAGYTTAPLMIYLAAVFDGLMGVTLTVAYHRCRKTYLPSNANIVRTDEAGLKEIAS